MKHPLSNPRFLASLLALSGASLLALSACSHAQKSEAPAETPAPASPPASPVASLPAAPNIPFDATRAWGLLQAQCDFGPRPMGSPAHEKCREFLIAQLRPLVDEWTTQNWTQSIARGPGAGRIYPMTNILGYIRGSGAPADPKKDRPDWLFCAHWDTRPVADQDKHPDSRNTPILGANDGASGVATLLEVARVLHENRPAKSVVIALWDGEDLGEFFYGARHFAKSSNGATWKKWKPQRAVLIDMIGDRDLKINREGNSRRLAPEVWRQVMQAAQDAGQSAHFGGPEIDIEDDHLPLNEAGIPAVDLIDFDYPAWHTLDDTPDKCSPESLKVIGDVLLRLASGKASA